MDNIFVVRGTEQAGPFTEADIRAQLASGTLTGDSLVWWEGLAEWTPISRTPLANPAAVAPAPVVSAPAAPAAFAPAASPTVIVTTAAPAEGVIPAPATGQTSTLAIISLVLGVLGLPGTICWPIGLILDIAAVITGHIARGQIRKDPSQGGKGLALAGLICGYIGVVLIVVVVTLSVLLALGGQTKHVFDTIQSQLNAQQHASPTTP